MTNQQIYQELRYNGFGTKLHKDCVEVYLDNRMIVTDEVTAVVDVPEEVISRTSQGGLLIRGSDS